MKYQATKKVTGGKLVRVKIEVDEAPGALIKNVQIHGDFFLHPEDALPHIEDTLRGLSRGVSVGVFTGEIERTLGLQRAAFVGMSAQDLADTIAEALAGSGENHL